MFTVTCHLRCWQNDRDLLCATAVTRGRTNTKTKVGTESCPLFFSFLFPRRSCRNSNRRHFNHESDALTTELFPLPEQHIEADEQNVNPALPKQNVQFIPYRPTQPSLVVNASECVSEGRGFQSHRNPSESHGICQC